MKSKDNPLDVVGIGSLVIDKLDPTRVGVVCVGAFRMDTGPGAWVLWPGEDYAWAALTDIELVSTRRTQ